jgi:hypothetical protein
MECGCILVVWPGASASRAGPGLTTGYATRH